MITDDYNLSCAGNSTKRILRRDLARLVDHEQIERKFPRRDELSHGERTDEKDRLQPLQSSTRVKHELAHSAMAPFLANLTPDDTHLALVPGRALLEITMHHFMPRRLNAQSVEVSKFRDAMGPYGPFDFHEGGVVSSSSFPQRLGHQKIRDGAGISWLQFSGCHVAGNFGEPFRAQIN